MFKSTESNPFSKGSLKGSAVVTVERNVFNTSNDCIEDSKDQFNNSCESADFGQTQKPGLFRAYGKAPLENELRYKNEGRNSAEDVNMNMTKTTSNMNATNHSHFRKPSSGATTIKTANYGDETFDVDHALASKR